MRNGLLAIAFFIACSPLFAQSLKDLSFGTDNTFEVATWNIEWYPKNGQTTIDSVTQIIQALNIDVLAIQEIDDTASFTQLLGNLNGWEGYQAGVGFPSLAYIYNTAVIEMDSIYEIYTNSPRELPRPPLVMELKFKGQDIIIINNHFKCCGNGTLDLTDPWDEETRRKDASALIMLYIDSNFSSKRVILLGDLNDRLTDNTSNNVFQGFLDDTSNYKFVDMDIALGSSSQWSYPSWPSHLDHILITNELFTGFAHDSSVIQTIRIDDYLVGGFSSYDANISDHRPVALKIQIDTTIAGLKEVNFQDVMLNIYPNPSSGIIDLSIHPTPEYAAIEIYNMNGQIIECLNVFKDQSSISWNAESLPNGVYYLKLFVDAEIKAVVKLVLIK